VSECDQEVAALWRRAEESLAAAEGLLRNGFPDFAASRSYYAVFYAASALHLSAGRRFRKHSGVIAHIHRDYVREGRLPPEIGRILSELADLRDVGDYGVMVHVEPDDAEAAIARARRFLDALKPLVFPG